MEIIKIAALALFTVMLIVLVKNYKPEFGAMTAIACSIVILYFLLDSLKFAIAYIADLYESLHHHKSYFTIILKIIVVAYITEFTSHLCKDAGETAIASKVELGGKIIIFCIAIPVFTSILQIVEQVL